MFLYRHLNLLPPLPVTQASWESAVTQIIMSIGLRGHICRIPRVGDLRDPTSCIALPPHYDFDSTLEETEAYCIFWHNDDIVEHCLVGKLSQEIQDSLPPKHGGDYDLPICTARDLLAFLRERFGIGSALAAEFTKAKVFELRATPATISSYVQSWHTAVHQLLGTPWDFTPWQKIQKFVDGLPNRNKAWGIIKEDVRRSWETVGPDGLFDFDILATCILNIAADQRCIFLSNCARSSPSAPTSNITAPNPTTASSGATASLPLSNDSSPSRPHLQCTNCNMFGHLID
ncbi:hypothetical protein C0993_011229 [Termitomyces sp. T159_Od127]|nr:hypothetical protein C0993_011229 [Termitomyces sp. T159_Od127]